MSATASLKTLVVAGDIVVDHHIYEGGRFKPAQAGKRGVDVVSMAGGAAGIATLLSKMPSLATWNVRLATKTPPLADPAVGEHSYAVWSPVPLSASKPDEAKVWRVTKLMGYGGLSQAAGKRWRPAPEGGILPADVLVLDDASGAFRTSACQAAWMVPDKSMLPPEWILLKLSGRIGTGTLWRKLIDDHADRLVCLVSANELRRENVSISLGLSWERTLYDMRRAFAASENLGSLLRARHLVVTFSADGALWLDRDGLPHRAELVYDAENAEGTWSERERGEVIGSLTGVAAALAEALANTPVGGALRLSTPIEAGLASMRNLRQFGHGLVEGPPPSGYPVDRIAEVLGTGAHAFAHAILPWDAIGEQLTSFVERSQAPIDGPPPAALLGLPRRVVVQGTTALKRLPHARFGKLVTADLAETEALRHIRRRMIAYRNDLLNTKPLSIGVFGPPGAGKSFGVRELAKEIFGESAWLEINLSQLEGSDGIFGALHRARDLSLEGKIPVVFWDEFDSKGLDWLRILLAPMQDASFRQGQLTHAIGRGVFVFAGGTSASYDAFGATADERHFTMQKGPDFRSRLDAFLNVLGPNQRTVADANGVRADETDIGFTLRRALLIRGFLAGKSDERLDIDPGLLDALLLVPQYRYGSRSLEKLVLSLRAADGVVRRSALSSSLVQMTVDALAFQQLLDQPSTPDFAEELETLAPDIHAAWLQLPDSRRSAKPHLALSYEELGPAEQEANRAAARRIPEHLALAGLGLEQGAASDEEVQRVRDHLACHLERLAEAEHEAWMAQKKISGWRPAEVRDDTKLRHDKLVPYAELTEEDRDRDRNQIRLIPDRAAKIGCRVIWLGSH